MFFVTSCLLGLFASLGFFGSIARAAGSVPVEKGATPHAPLTAQGTRLVFAQSDFPPFVLENKATLPAKTIAGCEKISPEGYGVDMDVAAEAARRAGFVPELQFYPFSRVKMLLKEKKIDAIPGLIYSEENGKPRHRFSIEYDDAGIAVIFQRSDAKVSIHTVEDLKTLQLGYVRDDGYGARFLEAVKKGSIVKKPENAADDDLQNFTRLVNGRVDAIIIHHSVGSWLIERNGWSAKVKLASLKFPYEDQADQNKTFVGFGYHVPEPTVNKFNEALSKMIKDSTIRCIKARYGITQLEAPSK